MRSSTRLAIAVSLVIVASSLAQERGRSAVRARTGVAQSGTAIGDIGFGVGVDPHLYYKSELLGIPEVLEELKATDEQKDQLKEAENRRKLAAAQLFEKIQGEKSRLKGQDDPAAEEAFRQQTLEYAKHLTRDIERPMLEVLDRTQVKRLEQIQIRADGYMAFSIADVTDRLGLTLDQAAEIAACISEGRKNVLMAAWPYRKASTELASQPEAQKKAQLASDAFQTMTTKAQAEVIKARSTTLQEIRKVLTSSQQATFKNMAGPPFDFDKLNPIKADNPTVPPQIQ